MSLLGNYYRAGSSELIEASLTQQGSNILLVGSGAEVLQSINIKQCSLSAPIGRMPYRVEFPNGDCFECDDHTAIETIFQPKLSSLLVHYWEKSRNLALLALVLLPIVTILYIKVGMPLMAQTLAPKIPQNVLLTLDTQALKQMEGYFQDSELEEPSRQLLLNAWDRLPGHQRYTLISKSSPAIGANAFALPGGHIMVTDELVRALNNENEILAVLAHEAGHVEEHHGIRNIIQSLGTVALLTVIVGDISALAETVLVSGPVLFQQLSYSRDLEREADRFSLQQLAQIDVPGSCLGAGLNHLMASHGINDIGDIIIEDAKVTPQTPPVSGSADDKVDDNNTNDINIADTNIDDTNAADIIADIEENPESEELIHKSAEDDSPKETTWKDRLKKQMGWDEDIDLRDALDYLQTHPGTQERIKAAGGTDCPAP